MSTSGCVGNVGGGDGLGESQAQHLAAPDLLTTIHVGQSQLPSGVLNKLARLSFSEKK